MKVLLDTNILIAAFIAHGTCHELFEDVARNHQLVSSRYILTELEEHLHRLGFSQREAREARTLVEEKAALVSPVDLDSPPGIDPDDLPVLGTAIAAKCDCIVTGDKELLALGSIGGIPLMGPSGFWRFEDRFTDR